MGTGSNQEILKNNDAPPNTAVGSIKDGIQKLSYLARLLEVQVSYSDFPKVFKN